MPSTTRPHTHAHRQQILRAVATYLASGTADPTVAPLVARFFTAAADAYSVARTAWLTAHGAWQSASAAAELADVDFDNALRRLMLSLRESSGKADHALAAALLGGVTASDLMAMRYAAELTHARAFLTRLDSRPDLSPSAERKASFVAATDALEAASSVLEAAWRTRLAAGDAQETATSDLDTAWGKLVRALRAVVDEGVAEALIPRFVRSAAAAAAEEEEGVEPA